MKAKVIVSDSFKTTITLYNHLNYSILYKKVTLLRNMMLKSDNTFYVSLFICIFAPII